MLIKSKIQTGTQDLTQGSIVKQLIFFTLPLLGSSLIQQLYNTVDLLFVGNFLGKEASAAVGSSSLIISCILGFFTGLSVGAGIIIAQKFGNEATGELRQAVHTAIGLSFVGGIALTVIGYLGAPIFLVWMNTPVEIMEPSVSYIRIYFTGLTAIITYNMGAGILRAVGNSRSPMIYQLVGGIANVVLDALFLFVFDWGVDGVAWATMVSQSITAIFVLIKLSITQGAHKFYWNQIRIHMDVFTRLLKVGVPVGLQTMIITLSNIFIQYKINSLGVNTIAAFTAYIKIELVIYLPIVAFGQALTTFSAQNIGAGKTDRMKRGTKICILMALILTAITSGVMLASGQRAFGIFNSDPAVISDGLMIIQITFPFYFLYVFLEVLGAAIRGGGNSTPPMMIVILNICVLRTILLFVITSFIPNVRGIALTYPITWGTTALCMAAYYIKGKWHTIGNKNIIAAKSAKV